MHNPQIYLGDETTIFIFTPEELPFDYYVLTSNGELLWSSVHTFYSTPK